MEAVKKTATFPRPRVRNDLLKFGFPSQVGDRKKSHRACGSILCSLYEVAKICSVRLVKESEQGRLVW